MFGGGGGGGGQSVDIESLGRNYMETRRNIESQAGQSTASIRARMAAGGIKSGSDVWNRQIAEAEKNRANSQAGLQGGESRRMLEQQYRKENTSYTTVAGSGGMHRQASFNPKSSFEDWLQSRFGGGDEVQPGQGADAGGALQQNTQAAKKASMAKQQGAGESNPWLEK